MDITTALLIALFSPVIGLLFVMMVKPEIKKRTNKKTPLHICNLILVIGILIYVSLLVCLRGEHIDSSVSYTEYPIQKLTLSNVYFDNRDGYSLNESYVILEDYNNEYENVVVVETEKYMIRWLWFCKIKDEGNKYHVYLSEENYTRLNNGNVIYEIRE